MSTMNDPTGRVLELLSLLQTHRFWTGTELAERLDVSERTLRRDVDRLRTLGYLVDATPGVAGGYRLAAGNHLPPLLLDDDEAVAIAVGLRAASDAAIEGIEDTSVRAMAKLEQVLPDRLRRRVNALNTSVVPLRWGGGGGPRVDPEALAVLSLACRDHEQVQFDYVRRDDEASSRLVEPHQLVSTGRRWYLVAWDVRRDDWRTFRLDRLARARLAGPRFTPRDLPAPDAATFVARSISSRPTRFVVELVVVGEPERIARSVQYAGGTSTPLDGGRCRVELSLDWLDWLISTIAQLVVEFGPDAVEVTAARGVEPDEVGRRLQSLGDALDRLGQRAADDR